MNKRGNQLIISIVIIVILLFATGILSFNLYNKKAYLDNVHLESDRITQGTQTKLYFDVINNFDTTLTPKIGVIINQSTNENCFTKIDEKVLDKVSPKNRLPTYVYINSNQQLPYSTERCSQRIFIITINLKDFDGKVLDSKNIQIGVV